MHNVPFVIERKRNGEALSDHEIAALVDGFAQGKIPDYQMSAFAMAVYFQGMTLQETTQLTRSMLDSGDQLKWPDGKPKVDKHSTGGVGDKVSIPLAPLLAVCGVDVPMISGRGLGATGGTLDKLESIAGYRCDLSLDEFRGVVTRVGCSISGATANLVPADRKLYALRDVTATVPSIPLITASILSKKFAEGLDALILDVKWGTGAFMKTLDQARQLARSLVSVAKQFDVPTQALITDMNQPLGRMIGNGVEIDESADVLLGIGPADVTEVTVELGARLLVSAGAAADRATGTALLRNAIETGWGWEKFVEMVREQGGDVSAPRCRGKKRDVAADEAGIVAAIDSERIGIAIIELGGGRRQLGDSIDHSVGIEFLVRVGDEIERGQPLAFVYCDKNDIAELAIQLVGIAVRVSERSTAAPQLIVEEVH